MSWQPGAGPIAPAGSLPPSSDVLSCGLIDTHLGDDPSATAGQTPPASFRYLRGVTDPGSVQVLLATTGSQDFVLGRSHPRRVLWLIEPKGLFPGHREYRYPSPSAMEQFDLVLTHRRDLAESLPNAEWMTHVGSWIDPDAHAVAEPATHAVEKTKFASFIASRKFLGLPGYTMRYLIKVTVTGYDGFGPLFGDWIPSKLPALLPYRFHIVIENDSCDWWHTEKLFDAFAARCVPLYWGGGDAKLRELGFDTAGILRWESPAGLQSLLGALAQDPAKSYASFARALETNHARTREIRCAEWLLERILRRRFSL